MTKPTATFVVGPPSTRIEIDYSGSKAVNNHDFLFQDMSTSTAPVSKRKFTISKDLRQPGQLYLNEGSTQLYSGDFSYDFACTPFNAALEEGASDNQEHLVLHAAALVHNGCGLVNPGKSGACKSRGVTWLTLARGGYRTDDLAFLNHDATIHSVTCPLSLRPVAMAVLIGQVPARSRKPIAGRRGTILVHYHLWPKRQTVTPSLNSLVFTRFTPGIPPSLTPISPGRACLYFMESYNNVRSYLDHGITRLAQVVHRVPYYFLRFGGFDGLLQFLTPMYAARL
jgi:hypothetical protein